MRSRTQLIVSPSGWIIGALMLLVLPLNWLFSAAIAAFFHELCHYSALRLCAVPVHRIQLSSRGASMETAPMSLRQEFFCALAGPLGGLVLLLFLRHIPRIAICAGVQSFFNLLPIYPLDGGRALRCITRKYFPQEVAENLLLWVNRICLGGIFLLALLAAIRYHLGLFPLLLTIILCIRSKKQKLLAKLPG